MIDESNIIPDKTAVLAITKESNELLSIFVAFVKKVKSRLDAAKHS
jgi:hypothetical protein